MWLSEQGIAPESLLIWEDDRRDDEETMSVDDAVLRFTIEQWLRHHGQLK
jgi:hypothetical protein